MWQARAGGANQRVENDGPTEIAARSNHQEVARRQ